jgi:hypothetical protein
VELEDEVVRSIRHSVDLLEHHIPLGLEIALAKQGTAYEVGEDLDRQREVGVEDMSLIAGVIPTGEGIEPAPADLELQGELPRRPPLGAFEHHVLEQVGDTQLAGPLVRTGGAHVNADRRRAHARQPFGEDNQPVRRRGPEQPLVETSRFHEELIPGQQRLPG